jgi:pimeloyl-ACP methyl ester carboxylesterase
MIGDDDEVSAGARDRRLWTLPDAELAVVPGTSHGLLVEKPDLCDTMNNDFLNNDPVPTFAPIRRAT